MIEVEDVKNWLRDGEDFDAASLMEQCEYILPTRFDDTEIPGIQPTIGYVDL